MTRRRPRDRRRPLSHDERVAAGATYCAESGFPHPPESLTGVRIYTEPGSRCTSPHLFEAMYPPLGPRRLPTRTP